MLVYEKMTEEYGLQALPSHILPVPPKVQFTKAKPVFSSLEFLPCAVTAPFMPFAPGRSHWIRRRNQQAILSKSQVLRA